MKQKTNLGHKPLYVAGIGASAGGLEALIQLVQNLPHGFNMAIVVIQHLIPEHKSLLVDILSRHSAQQIVEAKNNMPVRTNHIYVIPPNANITIDGNKLKVKKRGKIFDEMHLPINEFLLSLAREKKRKAIGVILSGTGFDGSNGIKAVKAAGGLTFAQNQDTSVYFTMPDSAIKTGSVDFALSPKDIAENLVKISKGHNLALSLPSKATTANNSDDVAPILHLLKNKVGVDFTNYRRTTILRRLNRRLAIYKFKNYNSYYNKLKSDAKEATALYKDLLISVTSFFRDPQSFTALKKRVLPALIKNRRATDPIRVWVSGCSTGQEVYTLAMVIHEYLEEMKLNIPLQMFGTDLNDSLISKARSAVFEKKQILSVPKHYLEKYFTKTNNDEYRVNKDLRVLCVFAKHNIIKDPPLSKLDIVSFRNVMIYLEPVLQKKVMNMLLYSLKNTGYVLLGSSESFSAYPEFFHVVDEHNKIYSKSATAPQARLNLETTAGHNPAYEQEKDSAMATTDRKQAKPHKNKFNEDMRTAMDEIQSSNEELQTLNEEILTGKEELESSNEELVTLNDELQHRNNDLIQINSDLNNLLLNLNIPVIIVDRNLKIRRLTPQTKNVSHAIATDLGRPLSQIKMKFDVPRLEQIVHSVIRTLKIAETEVKDSHGKWYSVRISPYYSTNKKSDGAVIAYVDITTARESQAALRDSLELSQNIVETINEPLIVLNNKMRVLSANAIFYKTFKVNQTQTEGESIYKVGNGQWKIPELKKLLEEILPEKTTFNGFVVTHKFPGIGEKTIMLNARQILDEAKKTRLILLSMLDITDLKAAEKVLIADKDNFERLVNEKTVQLMDTHQEMDSLKRLSDLGELAATVAHELRNPLAGINAAAYNLKRKTLNQPELAKHFDNITKKIADSSAIIDNLLRFSTAKNPSYETVRVNDVLTECMELVRSKHGSKNIEMVSSFKALNNVMMDVDPLQLKELLSNILDNACDAVPEKGKIEVIGAIEGKNLKIQIIDNGSGIDEENHKKIFKPFFSTKAKGTGLGLAVSLQIAHVHKGTLAIESKKDAGTAVTITLPLKKPATTA
jgi:two-component system CheB/CheR fusion protein